MCVCSDIDRMIREGRTEEAIVKLQKMMGGDGESRDELYYLLGNAHRKRGDFAKALNCYLEAMSINPESPATEAHKMLMSIIEFYHKDYYNP